MRKETKKKNLEWLEYTHKRKSKSKPKQEFKECNFLYCIWFRKEQTIGPRYTVEVSCLTHSATWSCMTNDLKFGIEIINDFPLVTGGLALGAGALKINSDCILTKIPPFSEREKLDDNELC